jgi:hypothetical protein
LIPETRAALMFRGDVDERLSKTSPSFSLVD